MKHFCGGVTDHVLGFVIDLCCLISCSYAAFNSALDMQLHKAQGFVMPEFISCSHSEFHVCVCVCCTLCNIYPHYFSHLQTFENK